MFLYLANDSYRFLREVPPRFCVGVLLNWRRYQRENPLGAEKPSSDETSVRLRC